MSNHVDLTIIAIAVGVMAIMAVGIIFVLARLLLHVMQLEQMLREEVRSLTADVHNVLHNVNQATEHLSQSVGQITRTATWLTGAVGLLVGFARAKRLEERPSRVSIPGPSWWMTGLRWLWGAYRQQKRRAALTKGGPPKPMA